MVLIGFEVTNSNKARLLKRGFSQNNKFYVINSRTGRLRPLKHFWTYFLFPKEGFPIKTSF